MKRKLTLVCALILLMSCVMTFFAGCQGDQNTTTQPTESTPFGYGDDFRLFREMTMNEQKHLLVFNRTESLSFDELVLAQAIQGIYARTGARYYCAGGSYDIWLQDMVEHYGFTYETVSLEQMVKAFIADYGSGYILYDRASLAETVNSACSVAGVTNYLPVDASLKERAEAWGLEMKIDCSQMTERTCFDTYKDQFSTDGLVQQSADNVRLRDYAIACGYFIFFRTGTETKDLLFRGEVHDWVDEDAPMFGWVPNDEGQDVTVASQYGQFTIPSDHALNMSVFTCKNAFGEADFTQTAKETDIVAQQGKHYVCIMMSDGDNVQTWYNSFPFDSKWFGAERSEDFPMGFSVQPGLLDLGPNVLNYLKRNAGKKDYFVCSVSGVGYLYPQVYPTLETYTKAMSAYLRRSGLSVVQILDAGPSEDVIEAYAKIPELKGAIYCYGEKYAAGNGSVYWSDGKPFVAIRETLWNADVEAMAERINSYSTDPTTIEAYTAINLHPWTMTYQDVVKLVSLLDEDVVVVTADDFIRLITENVPQEDVVRG